MFGIVGNKYKNSFKTIHLSTIARTEFYFEFQKIGNAILSNTENKLKDDSERSRVKIFLSSKGIVK